MRRHLGRLCLISVATAVVGSASASPAPIALPPVESIYPRPVAPPPAPSEPAGAEMTEQGRSVRGVYVPYPRLQSSKPRALARWARSLGATAVILDAKDDRGRVTFTRKIPGAGRHPHGRVRNIRKVVAALHEVGIYAIARVVCFKDNQLPLVRPEAAIRDGRHGGLWRDHTGMTWLDPHSEVAHAHVVAVARAAEEVGFDEVQLDYVRFPVDRRARYAQFPSRRGDPERHQVIAALLARVDRAIDVPLSADVFGLTAYRDGDPEGLGQSLEHLAPYLDAISPMVYLANWPRRYWESPRPAKTHALIHNAVRRVRRRLGDDIAVRPLLQAFKWRAENWGWGFVLNQVDAAETAGASGHLFWNQSGNYHMVASVWRHIDRKGRTFARR